MISINNKILEKAIKTYCSLNEIGDIEDFAMKCMLQGFNIIRFGASPKDNINREHNGIKDGFNNETVKQNTENTPRKDEGGNKENPERDGTVKEKEGEPIKEEKTNVKVKKIKVIRKK